MKKIALLFTVLCAGALSGMETEYGHFKGLGGLSPEIQVMIIQYLQTYENVDQVIKAIKATSLADKELNAIINQEYGNLPGFTKLVHILADKFNLTTASIATKFGTPAAKEYLRLSDQLLDIAMDSHLKRWNKINEAISLINDGADVNFSTGISFGDPDDLNTASPLSNASNVELVKLLLKSGAKIEKLDDFQRKAIEELLKKEELRKK